MQGQYRAQPYNECAPIKKKKQKGLEKNNQSEIYLKRTLKEQTESTAASLPHEKDMKLEVIRESKQVRSVICQLETDPKWSQAAKKTTVRCVSQGQEWAAPRLPFSLLHPGSIEWEEKTPKETERDGARIQARHRNAPRTTSNVSLSSQVY